MRLSHTLLVFHILFAPLTRLIFLFLGSKPSYPSTWFLQHCVPHCGITFPQQPGV